MSEVRSSGDPEELRRRLIERSAHDEPFRRDLLEDPKGAIERNTGARLPEGVEIRVVEETPDTIYLVLPRMSSGESGGDLSDRELEAIAGAGLGTDRGYTCGGASTCYYVDTVCSS